MPIKTRRPISRLNQVEFAEISFEVMKHSFAMHNQFGRFFQEAIYKRELATRMNEVRLEEPIEITFGDFRKVLFIDVLVGEGAIFEFKSVDRLAGLHRAQLIQYLMLTDSAHGKLINVRPEEIEHEFVNCKWTASDRREFRILHQNWNTRLPKVAQFREFLTEMLRDLGTGLELSLYEAAIDQVFGGGAGTETEVDVRSSDGLRIGTQRFRLISPGIAFKLTGFERDLDRFEEHSRRLLKHVDLQAIAWANIGLKEIQFKILE